MVDERGRAERASRVVPLLAVLLVPRTIGEGLVVDILAIGAAMLFCLAPEKVRRFAGVPILATWALAPAAYLPALFAFVSAVLAVLAVAASGSETERSALRRSAFFALAAALLPVVLMAIAWSAGGDTARESIRADLRLPSPSFDAFATALRVLCAVAVVVLASRRGSVVFVGASFAALVALVLLRGWTIASVIGLPADAHWSEPPILLNLLKIDRGAPFYGPYEDCNSYSYSPAMEHVHHALLRPLSLSLSLVGNRALCFAWQLVSTAILFVIVRPFVERGPPRAFAFLAMLLVATSSFLAPNLHPDHLLMPWFALALGVALHARRIPPRIFGVALLLLPSIAMAVKLTGFGIGLGLALALVWPGDAGARRRALVWLAGGALLAGLTLLSLERRFPRFLQWTVGLQASHEIRWGDLANVPFEDPGRFMLVVLACFGLSFLAGDRMREARRDAARVLLVTLGFALPSFVAYAKIGGRVNSLLPLTIGGAVALVRLAKDAKAPPALGAALLLWCCLTVTPRLDAADAALRQEVRARHDNAVALVRREVDAGRRTLLLEGTAAWIDAGQRTIPLDRWQTLGELDRGGHPEAEAHFKRLETHHYDSLVLSDLATDAAHSATAGRLKGILSRHYRLDGSTAAGPYRVYRWSE